MFIQHQALIDKRHCGEPWAQTLVSRLVNWLQQIREGRVESIPSILDFTDAVFKAWCCLFNSSVEFSPTTMNMLYVVIESTCGAVIDVEAANCCGASNRQSGTPSPPLAGVRVTTRRKSIGRGSLWPNSVGRSKSSIASWIEST